MTGDRRGRFLDGKLAFFYRMPPPHAGYAVMDGVLYRNGKLAATVEKVVFDRGALAWWVYYQAVPGTEFDRLNRARMPTVNQAEEEH